MPAAGQSIKRDMGHSVPTELELDQVEVVRPVRLFASGHARADRSRVLVEEVAAKIERMCSEFLGRTLRVQPSPAGLCLLGHKKGLVHAEEQEIAEIGAADRLSGRPMNAHETELIIDDYLPASLGRESNNCIRLLKCIHKRLLAKDVTTSLEPNICELEMGIRGGRPHEALRPGPLQHLRHRRGYG